MLFHVTWEFTDTTEEGSRRGARERRARRVEQIGDRLDLRGDRRGVVVLA